VKEIKEVNGTGPKIKITYKDQTGRNFEILFYEPLDNNSKTSYGVVMISGENTKLITYPFYISRNRMKLLEKFITTLVEEFVIAKHVSNREEYIAVKTSYNYHVKKLINMILEGDGDER